MAIMKRILFILLFLPYLGFSQIKISALTEATSLGSSDLFLVVQGGTTKKVQFYRFSYNSDSAAAQISDSLDSYATLVNLTDSMQSLYDGFEVDYLDLDTTATPIFRKGRLYWDDVDKCLNIDVHTNGTEVTNNIGQEVWIRVINKSGASIANGKAVYVKGSLGDRPKIYLANAKEDSTSLTFIGLTTSVIADNDEGFVTCLGNVRDVNTNSYTAGTVLYLDTIDGGWTSTRHEAPIRKVAIGMVNRKHATTGIIGVNWRDIPRLAGLSDVDTSGLDVGESLVWKGTRWENDSISSVSLGTAYQIPFMNGTTDFQYSDNFKWNDRTLGIKDDSLNTFIGYLAGSSTTIGKRNTFLGYQAGRRIDESYDNIMIGYNAGRLFIGQSSYGNIFIGNSTGNNAPGSNNIFIGDSSGYDELGSNKLYIENSNSATPLIYGDFANDTVRINGKLDVTGDLINDAPHVALYRSTDTTIAATQNIWYKIGGLTQKFAPVGMTVAGDSIRINKKGHFDFLINISFAGLNNEVWELAVFKNNAQEQPSQLRYTSTSDVGNMSCPVQCYSDGDDWFSVKIRNTTDNDDPTIKKASIIIDTQHLSK